MRQRTLLALPVALCAALVCSTAHAQPAVLDDAAFAEGVALRTHHQDAEALAFFQALHARTRSPRALAEMALCEAAMERWVDAEAHLIAALTALRDPWITRNRATLLVSLEQMRANIGTLVVETLPARAEVFIEGRRAGPSGAPIHVLAGPLTFEVRAEGRVTATRTVTIAANETLHDEVRLLAPGASVTATQPVATPPAEPEPTAAQPVATPPAEPPETARQPVATPPAEPPTAPVTDPGIVAAPPSGARRAVAWAGIGAGAVLVAGAVATWFLVDEAGDAFNTDARCLDARTTDGPACRFAQNTVDNVQPALWVAGGVGLALAITGTVLLATAPSTPSAARAGRCAPTLGVVSGVTCAITF